MEKITNLESLKKFYQAKLSTDKNWAIAGLLRVYSNQTEDEQATRDVSCRNGKGFTPADAKFLSCLAENYKARKNLTDRQMNNLYKLMPKYANQLINYSIEVGKVYKVGREYRFR